MIDVPHVEKLMSLGEANFRCILIKSKACSNDHQYHLLVIYNHAVGDGTSGMIITNQILSLYDEALEKPDVLETEIKVTFEKGPPHKRPQMLITLALVE